MKKETIFFNTVMVRLADGELNDFSANWDNNTTGFRLNQLPTLYDREMQHAREANEPLHLPFSATLIFGSLAITLGLPWPEQTRDHQMVFLLGLVMLFLSVYCLRKAFTVGKLVFARYGRVYEAELKRFASALEKTCVALRTDLDGLINGGRSGASDDARRLLDKAASDLLILENARDNAPSPEERQRYGAQAREQRDRLDELFDLFQSLKLEKRSLGGIIEQKKKELEPTMVA